MAEIVGIVTSILGPSIEVGKCIVDPIKRQFNYLCCFNTNIQNLRDEAKKLDDSRVKVQGQVDAAKWNTQVIVPEVGTWLDNVDAILENMSRVESDIQNSKNGCLGIKSRFSLSKTSRKAAEAMKELRDCSNFNTISLPPPPASMGPVLGPTTNELQSRKHVEEEIMTTLKEKKVGLMGICGMGGVGKTTMAKKIMSRVRGERVFDEIMMVIVSQQANMSRIQLELAELLGLTLQVESMQARAHQLRVRLTSSKRILIILDDLWERLDLEDLGIPHDLKECTIILTSRNRDIFTEMNVEKTFMIKILPEIEARSLFKEKCGACVDDPNLFPTAQEIVRECNGLPLALVTVGVALKDKRNKAIWDDAVQQLKSSNPVDMPYFLARVYNPIKLSYDMLESEHARSILLLCCLFPEDHDISIQYLTLYAWGLGILGGIRTLLDASNRIHALVDMLKSRSLLLHVSTELREVKMHDIVRDVAIFIAEKQGLIDSNLSLITWPQEETTNIIDCSWLSLFQTAVENIMLRVAPLSPNLRLLLITRQFLVLPLKAILLSNNFFGRMIELNVLSIGHLSSLPLSIQLLKNLRTLVIDSCYFDDISVVGELTSLETLYCRECYWIKEVPEDIGRLNRLKLLDFSLGNNAPHTIAPGVLSRLVRLEELTFWGNSFKNWVAVEEGKERKNAALVELNSLSSLTSLRIVIEDASLAAEQIQLSSNLLIFDITIGTSWGTSNRRSYQRKIKLELKRDVIPGDWIHKLLKTTESLVLDGEGSNKLLPHLSGFKNLKSLQLNLLEMKHEEVTTLIDGRSSVDNLTVFPVLQFLSINDLDHLEEIYRGPISSDSFKNLEELSLRKLPKLQHLWSSTSLPPHVVSRFLNMSSICIVQCHGLHNLLSFAATNDCVSKLERLEIYSCSMMEQVLSCNEDENVGKDVRRMTFPKLTTLKLFSLPKMTNLFKGVGSIEFPVLTNMEIGYCPNMKTLVSSRENDQQCPGAAYIDEDDPLHLFCKQQVTFGRVKKLQISSEKSRLWCNQIPTDFFTRLDELEVSNCGNIETLFSASAAKNLVNLGVLKIKDCSKMVTAIEKEEVGMISELLINLKGLYLEQLPKLKAFCDWRCDFKLKSVTNVRISQCPQMGTFSSGTLITPKLETIIIDGKVVKNTKNLNDALNPLLQTLFY